MGVTTPDQGQPASTPAEPGGAQPTPDPPAKSQPNRPDQPGQQNQPNPPATSQPSPPGTNEPNLPAPNRPNAPAPNQPALNAPPPPTAPAPTAPATNGPDRPAPNRNAPGDPKAVANRRRLAGRYRLDEVLGRGATGTVWGAYDEMLRRRVAVKEVPPPPGMPAAEADVLRERTLREARAIGVLSHPNVVTLYDVVQQDGEPYVVMELLPARTLASLISERGRLDVGSAALVGSAVASALQSAHQAGITHRDVKPGNVLIGEDGRIKLTDFGISRNVSDSPLTVTGMTLGSPAFIAPEVASGGQVTPAADLWGLGATLFAAVEGRPPFDAGGDALATVAAVVHGPVPAPASAGPLAPVIAGLMVKDPARRMPLERVRQLLHPLLPPDGRVLRDARPEAAETVVIGRPIDTTGQRPDGAGAAATVDVPLAPHPGPLPFRPPARRRQRSAPATALLTIASIVLFAGGLGGGFALARAAAGAPVLPALDADAPVSAGVPTTGSPRPAELVGQTLTVDDADPNATFTIGVPDGWVSYRADLNARPGLAAVIVSPDGGSAVTVERLPGFYPDGSVEGYVKTLENELNKAFTEHAVLDFRVANVAARPGASEPPHELTYRTVSTPIEGSQRTSSGQTVGRSTFVQLIPTRHDLWVLKVTVATEQESAARAELFDEVRSTFAPAAG